MVRNKKIKNISTSAFFCKILHISFLHFSLPLTTRLIVEPWDGLRPEAKPQRSDGLSLGSCCRTALRMQVGSPVLGRTPRNYLHQL